MTNIVKFLILIIISTLIFGGCSSSTEPDPEPGPDPEVVKLLTDGMWEKVDSTGVVDTTEERRARFKYNSDYTGEMYMLWEGSGGEWDFMYTFTWKLENSSTKLFFSSGLGSAYAEIEKLTETELILYWIEEDMRDFYIKVPDQSLLF